MRRRSRLSWVALLIACGNAAGAGEVQTRAAPADGTPVRALRGIEIAQAPGASVPPIPQAPAIQAPAPAAAPAAAGSGGPKFEIRKFDVEGATLIGAERIDAVLQPFTGAGREFGDVQRALEALERVFIEAGYGSVQVLLPEQELEQGVVKLKVIEPRLTKITVEGNSAFSEANVRASLPALSEGAVPNSKTISANLKLANENPAKSTTVVLRAGATDGEVDAVVRVSEDRTTRWNVSLDNSGTTRLNTTGSLRLGVGVQMANLWGRDHVLAVQATTSPQQRDRNEEQPTSPDATARLRTTGISRDVAILGLQYRIPLYERGDMLDFTAGYSNVNSGVVSTLTPFTVSGRGTQFGVRYTQNLATRGGYEHRLIYGLDWRIFNNSVLLPAAGQSTVPDITVHPVSLTYTGVHRDANTESSFYVGYNRNLPGGNDGGSGAFEATTAGSLNGSVAGARPGYSIWRYGVTHTRVLPKDWQFRFNLAGQETQDRLIPQEQFGLGGALSIRGLAERQFALDTGLYANIELYTPELSTLFKLGKEVRLRALVFHDTGHLVRSQAHFAGLPAPVGEPARYSASSTGLGLRMALGSSVSMRLDAAFANLPGDSRTIDPLGQVKQFRLHGAMVYLF